MISWAKLLLVLIGLGLAVYAFWPAPSSPVAEPSPPPEVPLPSAVEPEPEVSFATKMRVKRILEEWKRRSLSTDGKAAGVARVKIEDEMLKIKDDLYKQGYHDPQSLRKVLTKAAMELGHSAEQAEFLVGQVLSPDEGKTW